MVTDLKNAQILTSRLQIQMGSQRPRKAWNGALEPQEHQECISGQKRTIGIREKWCARPYNISQLSISSPGVAVLILGHRIAHSPPLKLLKGALNSYQHPNHESAPLQLIRGLFQRLLGSARFMFSVEPQPNPGLKFTVILFCGNDQPDHACCSHA